MSSAVEKNGFKLNGFLMLILNFAIITAGILILIAKISIVLPVILFFIALLNFGGFMAIEPNESRVLIFFGSYVGIVKESGFWWTNPLTSKEKISLRVHNFNSDTLKVNDKSGNPIEIAAVISWKVIDSAKAIFDVEKYSQYVSVQSESSIRTIATKYPYDSYKNEPGHENSGISLRENSDQIGNELVDELKERLEIAGVEVLEARISHLAYAPEIAQAMLRRQQAEAVIMARQKIVEGAVSMVELALKNLEDHNVVKLDDEKKATMINNLLVTLTSEKETQPVVNTGSLYS